MNSDVKNAKENANHYFNCSTVNWEQIYNIVDEIKTENNMVLLVGSVAEGNANFGSDIDLVVLDTGNISAHGLAIDSSDHSQISHTIGAGRAFNVEFWSVEKCLELGKSLTDLIDSFSDVVSINALQIFNENELRLMHRIRCGLTLWGDDRMAKFREQMSSDRFEDYVTLLGLSWHVSSRKDAYSQSLDGDLEAALFMLQNSFACLAMSLLGSYGETNLYDKSKITLLKEHKAQIGGEVVDRIIDRLLPGRRDDIESFVDESLEFADHIIQTYILENRTSLR
jgi:hypothetical protein